MTEEVKLQITGEAQDAVRAVDSLTKSVTASADAVKAAGVSASAADPNLQKMAASTTALDKVQTHLHEQTSALTSRVKEMALGYVTGEAALQAFQAVGHAAVEFMRESIGEALEADKVQRQLTQALRDQGYATPQVISLFDDLAKQYQNTTVYSDELIKSVEALLVQVGGVAPSEMNLALKATTDLASGLHIDLRSAAMLVAKAFEDNFVALKKAGIAIDETRAKGEGMTYVLGAIEERFGGQAQAEASSYAGQITQIGNQYKDLQESIGTVIVQSNVYRLGLVALKAEIVKTNVEFQTWILMAKMLGQSGIPQFAFLRELVGDFGHVATAADVAREHNEAYAAGFRQQWAAVIAMQAQKTEADKKAAKAAQDHADAIQKEADALGGRRLAAEMRDYSEAVALAVRQGSIMPENLQAIVDKILKYKAAGLELTPVLEHFIELHDLYLPASVKVTMGISNILAQLPEIKQGFYDAGVQAAYMTTELHRIAITSKDEFGAYVSKLPNLAPEFKAWGEANIVKPVEEAEKEAAEKVAFLGQLINSAVGQGINAASGRSSLASGIRAAAMAGVSTAMTTGATIAGSLALGATTFGIGAAAVGVGALVKKLLPDHKGRDLVEEWVTKEFGSFDALHQKLGKELPADAERFWIMLTQGVGSGNKEQAQAAIDAITAALDEQKRKTDEAARAQQEAVATIERGFSDLKSQAHDLGVEVPADLEAVISQLTKAGDTKDAQKGVDDLKAAFKSYDDLIAGSTSWKDIQAEAEQYGVSVDSLNSKFQQSKLESGVRDIAKAWQDLSPYVDDASVLAAGFKDEVQDALDRSYKFGIAIPDSLKPLIQKLMESGSLLDANGDKLDDISKVNFEKDPIAQGLDTLNNTLKDILQALKDDLPNAFGGFRRSGEEAADHVTDAFSRIPKRFEFDFSGNGFDVDAEASARALAGSVPRLAKGGIVTRPTLALIGEAGPEMVTPLTGPGAGGLGVIHLEQIIVDGSGREIGRHAVDLDLQQQLDNSFYSVPRMALGGNFSRIGR